MNHYGPCCWLVYPNKKRVSTLHVLWCIGPLYGLWILWSLQVTALILCQSLYHFVCCLQNVFDFSVLDFNFVRSKGVIKNKNYSTQVAGEIAFGYIHLGITLSADFWWQFLKLISWMTCICHRMAVPGLELCWFNPSWPLSLLFGFLSLF